MTACFATVELDLLQGALGFFITPVTLPLLLLSNPFTTYNITVIILKVEFIVRGITAVGSW